MISTETEAKVAQLFYEVARGEEAVEFARETLAAQAGFSLGPAYDQLSQGGSEPLTSSQLQEFLAVQKVNATAEQVAALIQTYDADADLCLSLTEFAHLVYPATNAALRQLAASRPPTALSLEALAQLTLVLVAELELQNKLASIRKELCSRYDFDEVLCFSRLDTLGTRFINKTSLKIFFSRHKLTPLDKDMAAILRRVDGDGDNLISYEEFCEFIGSRLANKPLTEQQPHTEIGKVLQQYIQLRTEIDNLRTDLASAAEFNLTDAFRTFDAKGVGFLAIAELETGLRSLRCQFRTDQARLLLRNYSGLQDGKLHFSDFAEMLMPATKELAEQLRKRRSSRNETGSFTPATQEKVAQLCNALLAYEAKAETMRQSLARASWFEPHAVFYALDIHKRGALTLDEFEKATGSADYGELQCLLTVFDKNRDGRVTYSEFLSELTPKSEQTYSGFTLISK